VIDDDLKGKISAFKGNLGCVIAGFVKPLHRLKERLVLLLVGRQLDHKGLFHTLIVDYIVLYVKSLPRLTASHFPPASKLAGIQWSFL